MFSGGSKGNIGKKRIKYEDCITNPQLRLTKHECEIYQGKPIIFSSERVFCSKKIDIVSKIRSRISISN